MDGLASPTHVRLLLTNHDGGPKMNVNDDE